MKNLPNQFFYSKEEDRLNVISHGIGFILSIIGLIFLLNKGLQDFNLLRFLSFLIYGISLSTMYIASTLYHNSKTPEGRYKFRLFDMVSIYLLIAGSYTLFTLTVFRSFSTSSGKSFGTLFSSTPPVYVAESTKLSSVKLGVSESVTNAYRKCRLSRGLMSKYNAFLTGPGNVRTCLNTQLLGFTSLRSPRYSFPSFNMIFICILLF